MVLFRITENEPSKMHNVRPYVYSRPWLEHCVKIDSVQRNGLYLTPHKSLPGVHGDGLYLKRDSTIQDGSRLILGENSPFKNIPILNL